MAADYSSFKSLLGSVPHARDLDAARDTIRDQLDALTLVGNLVSQNESVIFVAGGDKEVWQIPKDGVISVAEAEDVQKGFNGIPVTLLVKNGTRVVMQREYEVGKDIVAPSLSVNDDPGASGSSKNLEGYSPSKYHKKGWY
ncbi:hypothetical protein [Acaryochloris sp. IP29b_bin.148]|uniref:hypothetical protein n=1 Tax=Acaryochloris sp. IP29b_bin.148 TaxID=2969218 RepID=UPI002633FF94|nr:hypothetical protein [Acaryochloris sp. IP29b_bin.148]